MAESGDAAHVEAAAAGAAALRTAASDARAPTAAAATTTATGRTWRRSSFGDASDLQLRAAEGGFINAAFELTKSQRSLSLRGVPNHVAAEDGGSGGGGELKSRRKWGATFGGDGPVVRLEQLAPANQTIVDQPSDGAADAEEPHHRWPFKITRFTSAKRSQDKGEYQKLSRRVRSYYKKQDELIEGFEQIAADQYAANEVEEASLLRKSNILAKLSLFANIALLVAKGVAAGMSGSLAVISSLVDSAMDLVAGGLFWYTSRKIKQVSPYLYPTGRTRLEPIAIVVLAVIMAVASFQLIVESIRDVATIVESGGKTNIVFDNVTLSVLSVTMLLKAVLYFACRTVDTPSAQALAQDHRNDVLSNAVAAVCGFVAFRYWAYLDPLGAILISLYIMVNWWRTGAEQVRMLTGHTAQPAFLNRITWLCLGHDPRIRLIDTVRAYHFGNDFLVEVHIVLPEEMSLKEAHDIGEPLQQKLERLPEVARAFVHLDYETEHDPTKEHKMPFG